MRYPASEKLEIIRLVERSHLPAKRSLEMLGVSKTPFYRWCDRSRAFGESALEDRRPHPGRVWNRIPDAVRQAVVDLALDEPELSPRDLAVQFTDTEKALPVRGFRVPHPQGAGPDHKPGRRRDRGRAPVHPINGATRLTLDDHSRYVIRRGNAPPGPFLIRLILDALHHHAGH